MTCLLTETVNIRLKGHSADQNKQNSLTIDMSAVLGVQHLGE